MINNKLKINIACQFWGLAALALAACAPSENLLNSERIERQFGSYAVRVLDASGDRRLSSLESRHRDRAITRTLAIVSFAADGDGSFAREHGQIVDGGSIGATFKAAGWTVDKTSLDLGTLTIPATAIAVGRLMDLALPADLAMHAYRFVVSRDGATKPYATIVELHHPAYLDLYDLRRLYGDSATASGADPAALRSRVLDVLNGLSPELAP